MKLAIAAVGAGAAAFAAYAAAIAYLRDRRWKSLVRTRDRPKLKIGYWAIRGLAAPLRMAAAYGGLAAGILGLFVAYKGSFYDMDKFAYNQLHPYTSWCAAGGSSPCTPPRGHRRAIMAAAAQRSAIRGAS